jgi:hypothetical protein
MYLTQRTAIIKTELKVSPEASLSDSLLQNFEEENRHPSARQQSASTTSVPLSEYITDGSAIYTRGNLFFPLYYQIAFTMLRFTSLLSLSL